MASAIEIHGFNSERVPDFSRIPLTVIDGFTDVGLLSEQFKEPYGRAELALYQVPALHRVFKHDYRPEDVDEVHLQLGQLETMMVTTARSFSRFLGYPGTVRKVDQGVSLRDAMVIPDGQRAHHVYNTKAQYVEAVVEQMEQKRSPFLKDPYKGRGDERERRIIDLMLSVEGAMSGIGRAASRDQLSNPGATPIAATTEEVEKARLSYFQSFFLNLAELELSTGFDPSKAFNSGFKHWIRKEWQKRDKKSKTFADVTHGLSVTPGIYVGRPVVVNVEAPDPSQIPEGAVVVAHNITGNMEEVLRRAGAIVQEEGSEDCHLAKVARSVASEGISKPVAVGVSYATEIVQGFDGLVAVQASMPGGSVTLSRRPEDVEFYQALISARRAAASG